MGKKYDYDLLVLGGGPGGYVAAIRASQLGLKVVVIEKDKLGGVCLNVGCIPSKSLIHQASTYHSVIDMEKLGLKIDKQDFDYGKVQKKSRKSADMLSRGISFLMKKNKIDVIEAEGVLSGVNEVSLSTGEKVTGKNIIIATGSKPTEIPAFPFDENHVLSSTGVLMLEELPNSMLILGAGAIGVEFAYILNSFGVKVHLVELMDRILPIEDEEVSALLNRSFRRSGIKVMTSTKAMSMEFKNEQVITKLEDKNGEELSLAADKVLVAVGRTPNTSSIGLESVGIKTEDGYISIGDFHETSVAGIYAVGDVVNTPLLAHVASKEGEIAAGHIAGHPSENKINPMEIPSAVYCEPQVGSFGYTEWRAQQEGISYEKAVFPYRGAGKAVAIEKPDGFIKIIYDPETKAILGAHCVGTDATEIIHQVLLAKTAGLIPEDVGKMIHAHPTISEAVMEAMRAVDGRAIHA